jgi:hypothetical protein
VKTGVLNVFYRSDESPLERLTGPVVLPSEVSCPAWEPWKYATLESTSLDAVATAALIERLFVGFCDFPADTEVATERGHIHDTLRARCDG